MVYWIYWITFFVVALICAALCADIAKEKGFSTVGPFFWGFLLGPLGVLGAVGLPDRKLNHKMELLIDSQNATLAVQNLVYEQLKWQSMDVLNQSRDQSDNSP